MNSLKNIKTRLWISALAAVLALINPGPVSAEEAVSSLNKDWLWTVQNQTQDVKTPPAASGKKSDPRKDIFAPTPRIDSPFIQKTGDTCEDPGEKDGFYRCIKTFSNGFSVMISNDQEHHGEEFKRQTRIAEFNEKGEAQNSRTIRRKIAYQPFTDEKKIRLPRAEFFDIVNRPKNSKITREVITYEYRPESGNLKTLTWTSYEQIDETQFAMITRHIALNFDENGNPLQGRAEKWKDQRPFERMFYWDRNMSGPLSIDAWKSWQNQILQASPRQVF